MGQDDTCPEGFECKSYHCGHECYPIAEDIKIGPCWERCTVGQDDTCPEGFECKSNGCGHECYPTSTASPTPRTGLCHELCRTDQSTDTSLPACPEGYRCLSNGCGHECYPIIKKFQPLCPDIVCIRSCPFGYESRDGCSTCSCKEII
ncbi:WAP four-disulfide core domain protein 3 isoform X2 [Biomphalaria glabrata]|nr:WAP four-disulfide core domain protein 3 isoform X2 [Biomphalaria glabrata]